MTFWVDDELAQLLEKLCAMRGESKSVVLRDLLRERARELGVTSEG